MTFYWQITAFTGYLEQVSQIDIPTQAIIQRKWIEVASSPDPKDVGGIDTCGSEEDNAVLVVFEDLEYEFIYEIDKAQRVIRLINCKKLTFLEEAQNIRIDSK